MVFTIVTVVFLPMSFIAAVFTIPIRDFPHQTLDGSPSLPLSYVSKFVFGVGLAISIPLIAVAFAVDNLDAMIRRNFTRLGRLTHLGLWRRGRGNQTIRDAGAGIDDLNGDISGSEARFPRRSGDTYKARSTSRSYDDEIYRRRGSQLAAPRPRRSVVGNRGFELGGWKEEPGWNGGIRSSGSRDLERGGRGDLIP